MHTSLDCLSLDFMLSETKSAFLFIFCFLGPCLWHMEVPRLGVKSELLPLAYTTATATRDLSRTASYTTAHGNTGSLTH